MEKLIDGIWNFKTTILAIITFVLGVIPSVVQVLTDLGAFLTQLGSVLSSGDIAAMLVGLWSLKAPLLALIASVGLLLARDWRSAGDIR